MNMGKALKIALRPRNGTAIYLGIMAAVALLEFAIIEHQPLLRVLMFTLGSLFLSLGVKLIFQLSVGMFIQPVDDSLPRGSMLLLILILHLSGSFLLFPHLLEHTEMSGV